MNRRQFLQSVGGGMVGVVATENGLAFHDPSNSGGNTAAEENTCADVVYTYELPELDWNTKQVPEHGVVINWYDGHEQDAEWVASLVPHIMPKANEVFPYEQQTELVINLYPRDYYPRHSDTTSYDLGLGKFVVETPSDHLSGESFGEPSSYNGIWYRHAILDGVFSKRVFERQSTDVIMGDWFAAGFFEELTVNHTYSDIQEEYNSYTPTEDARKLADNGFASILTVSDMFWSGSRFFAASLIDELGVKPIVDAMIGGPHETFDANLEAKEGVSELDLFKIWYMWLDENTDGDYSESVSKLSTEPVVRKETSIDELGAAGLVGGAGGTALGYTIANKKDEETDS